MKLVCLVDILTEHGLHKLRENTVEVGIEDLLAAEFIRLNKEILNRTNDQIRDQMMLDHVLQARVYKGLEVHLILEYQCWHIL